MITFLIENWISPPFCLSHSLTRQIQNWLMGNGNCSTSVCSALLQLKKKLHFMIGRLIVLNRHMSTMAWRYTTIPKNWWYWLGRSHTTDHIVSLLHSIHWLRGGDLVQRDPEHLYHQQPSRQQRWNNQPCHTSPKWEGCLQNNHKRERIHHCCGDAPNLSSLIEPPAAGSLSRTTLSDVLPATSPCHQGENWSHLKFRVTSSDWSLGSRRAGRMAEFEMGELGLINK